MKHEFLATSGFATLLTVSATGASASGSHYDAIGKPGVAADTMPR